MRRASLSILALTLAVGTARASELFIRSATLIDGSGAPPRASVDIVIAGDRIQAIEPSGRVAPRDEVIEAADLTALPGLIDSHVHFVAASGSAFRHDSDEALRELTHQHLRAYLACGVTTVLDPGTFTEVAREIQGWLAAGNPG